MARAAAMRRMRVATRWAVISLVGVTMAAFIVFDVLDLDGSNLRHPATGNALTADTAVTEAERLLLRTPDFSAAPGWEVAATRLPLPMRSAIAPPDARPSAFRPYHSAVRAQVPKETLRDATSNVADPA